MHANLELFSKMSYVVHLTTRVCVYVLHEKSLNILSELGDVPLVFSPS